MKMDKVPKRHLAFYQRLVATGWICFSLQLCKANEQWVREFYANLKAMKLSTPIMRIRGKMVNFRDEVIN